jgi:hypothetical protein
MVQATHSSQTDDEGGAHAHPSPTVVGTLRACSRRFADDRTLLAVAGIALIALGLRLAVVWHARAIPATPGNAFDSPTYLRLASDWSRGRPLDGVFHLPPRPTGTDWYYPPGYPVFVGAIEAVRRLTGDVGSLRVWVGVIQSVLGAWMVLLVGLLARRMPGRPAQARALGVGAAAVLAVWPNQVIGAAVVMSEGLFTPALVSAVALLVWRRDAARWQLATSGAIFGALIFTRYSAVPLLLPALYVAIVGSAERLRSVRLDRAHLHRAGWFLGGCILIAAPWSLFFHRTVGTGFYPQVSSAYNLCSGNHPGWDGRFDYQNPTCDLGTHSYDELNKTTRRWILGHLDEQPRLIQARFSATMASDHYNIGEYPHPADRQLFPGENNRYSVLSDYWWRGVGGTGLAGLAIGIAAWRPAFRRTALVLLSSLVGALVTTGTGRYHDSIVPLLAICIATVPVAAMGLAPRFRRGSPGRAGPALSATASS